MRASGYSEALGFTVYDTLIYKRHLERLVREEVEVMMERVAGEMDTDAGGRPARARGRADARPGRRAAREAARGGAAGAPRRAAARERHHDPRRAAGARDHDELFAIYAAVVEEGGAFPREPPAARAEIFHEGWMRRQDRACMSRCSMRRWPAPTTCCRTIEGLAAHIAQRGLHGRAGVPAPRGRPRARRALARRGGRARASTR